MSNDLFWPGDPQYRDPGDRDPGDTMPLPGSAGWGTTAAPADPGPERPRAPWRTTAAAAGLAALVFGGVGVGVGAEFAGGSDNNPATNAGLTVAPISAKSPADPRSLAEYVGELRALRASVDVVVASHHWGLHEDVLDYQVEIAHAAVDAGADVVMGHGPHYACAVETYRGKPIFYGLGCLSFHTGHGGHAHGDWVGMVAKLSFDGRRLARAAFEFVRHNEANETYICRLVDEEAEFIDLEKRSRDLGARLTRDGNDVVVSAA